MRGLSDIQGSTSVESAASPSTTSHTLRVTKPNTPTGPRRSGPSSHTTSVPPSLVRRAQAGDSMAMQDLLDRLGPYVLRTCEATAPGDGADAAQEALIIVFSRLGQLKDPAALFGWARSIAVREAIRCAQVSKRAIPAELDDRHGHQAFETDLDVRDVLAGLSADHREVLMLRDLHDLDEKTVARMLDVSAGTVKSRLHRARRRFREAWNQPAMTPTADNRRDRTAQSSDDYESEDTA